MSASLRFLAGQRTGQIVVVPPGATVTGGRDGGQGLELPGANVSRLHMRLSWDGEALVVENLSHVNGLYVNGVRTGRRLLSRWDTVVVGPNVLRVESLPGDEAPRQPADHPLLAALIEIQRLLAAGGSDLIAPALAILIDALPATRLAFIVRDEDGTLRHGPITVRGQEPSGPPSLTFAARVLDAGRPLLLETAGITDLFTTLRDQAVQTALGAPVMGDGAPVGVLLADNLHEPGRLDHTHLRGLEMLAKALEAVFQRERTRAMEREHLRLDAETAAARNVQRHLFVADPAGLPGPCRWQAYHQPALELCGDFWDCAATRDGVLWLVADVSGKGLPAALLVSMLKVGFKALCPQAPRPAHLLAELHRLVAGEIPATMFFTAVSIHVDATGRLTYASVGHPPGVLVHADGTADLIHGQAGMLGSALMPLKSETFVDQHIATRPGDRLCLYTDGVSEASDGTNPDFGEAGLRTTLLALRHAALDTVVPGIVAAVAAHHRGRITDDVTLVVGEWSMQG